MPKARSKKPSRTAKPTARKAETRAADGAKARTTTPRSSVGKRPAAAKTRKKAAAKTGGGKKAAKKVAAKTPRRETSADGAAVRAPRAAKRAKPQRRGAADVALAALEEMKAQDVNRLDVRHLTSVTDTMIIASGRSDRHVRAVADAVILRAKQAGHPPIGVEGQEAGEWVLVDLGDVVVHVMLPRVRDFYKLESLWDINARDAVAER